MLLGSALSSFNILRRCLFACKVIFLLRTFPYNLAVELARKPQARIRSALIDNLDASLDDTQWDLAGLPVRRGGLGILDPATVVTPAHVAVVLSSSAAASAGGLPS